MAIPPLGGVQIRVLLALRGAHARGVVEDYALHLGQELGLLQQSVGVALRSMASLTPALACGRVVRGPGRPPRHCFRLTQAGQDVVAELLATAAVLS